LELVPGVSGVGPDEFKLGQWLVDLIEKQRRAVAVLHAGGMDAHFEDQTIGIHQQMALSSHDLLARIVAAHSTKSALSSHSACSRWLGYSRRSIETPPTSAFRGWVCHA
jgi:hypothetical protein